MRRGLVLEGGGAKGAFQFGVLLALREAGIHFDAVSGTSVGALNAALIASDQIEEGRKLWNDLSTRKVFRVRLLGLTLLPISAFCHLFVASTSGHLSSLTPMPLRLLFFLIQRLPALVISVFWFMFGWHEEGLLKGCSIVFGVVAVVYVLTAPTTPYSRIMYFMACCVTVYLLWSVPLSRVHLIGLVVLLPALLWLLGVILQSLNISLFDPSPLKETIEAVVAAGLRIPLFATVTTQIYYYDPDDLSYYPVSVARGGPVYYEPFGHPDTRPRYERVDREPRDVQVETLLATAALPLGIVPGRLSAAGEILIDGGVVDNVPWLPLTLEHPCDELVIVGCNPFTWDDEAARETWRSHERICRLIERNFTPPTVDAKSGAPANVHNDPPQIVPFAEPAAWPSRVVVLAPSEPLGSFLSATINFNGARARRMVQEGLSIGRAAVKQHWRDYAGA